MNSCCEASESRGFSPSKREATQGLRHFEHHAATVVVILNRGKLKGLISVYYRVVLCHLDAWKRADSIFAEPKFFANSVSIS